jgi:hypothetical protein
MIVSSLPASSGLSGPGASAPEASDKPPAPAFRRSAVDSTTQAQWDTWREVFQTSRRALGAWEVMNVGGHPIQPPNLAALRGTPMVTAPIWAAYKEADGTLHISSADFPRRSPHLAIKPPTLPQWPPTCVLDGKVLGENSSLRDLQMARLLAETLDIAV